MGPAGDPQPGIRVNDVPMGGEKSPISVGRSPSCDVVLRSPVVSGRHGTISREGGTWVFRDEGSTNGTYVAGVRTDRVEIAGRAVLMLGHPVEGAPLEIETVGPVAEAPAERSAAPDATQPVPPSPPAPAPPQAQAAPQPPPVPPSPAGPAIPSPLGVATLQSRVVFLRRLRRDEAGTLRLVGDRVVLTSDERGQVFDVPVAALRARFPRDEEATIAELDADGRTHRLSFGRAEGVGMELGRYAAAAWREALAGHRGAVPPPPAAPS